MDSEEIVQGDVSINISGFEHFLRNWIDNDRLAFILGVDASIGGTIRRIAGILTSLPTGLPRIKPLVVLFEENGQTLNIEKLRILCQYTDLLLDYVIYIFKYYGYDFKMVETHIDKHDTGNIILAERLTKIYQIISTYIIGNPDLSIKEERVRIKYETKHRMIFKVIKKRTYFEAFSDTFGIARGESQQTDYVPTPSTSPLHHSLQDSPLSSPRRGGTRKIRRQNKHRKTYRSRPLTPPPK
jgi:hypothetical protein